MPKILTQLTVAPRSLTSMAPGLCHRILAVSPRLRELAHAVLISMQHNDIGDVEDWARHLAEDVAKAND